MRRTTACGSRQPWDLGKKPLSMSSEKLGFDAWQVRNADLGCRLGAEARRQRWGAAYYIAPES